MTIQDQITALRKSEQACCELLEAAAGWRRLMAEGKYPALCNPLNPGGITREWDKRQWLRAMEKARQLKGPKLP